MTLSPTTQGTYTLTVTGTDEEGEEAEVDIAVEVTLPEFTLTASQTSVNVILGDSAAITLGTSGAFGAVSYSASPSWAAVSGTTLTLAPDSTGYFTVNVTARDGAGRERSIIVAVDISAFSLSVSPETLNITAGNTATAEISTESARGTVSYSANYEWASFDGNTLKVSPTTAGDYQLTVTGKDSSGKEAECTLSVTATQPETPAARISITTSSLTAGTAGEHYSYILAANISGAKWRANGLPSWLTLNADSGELSGIPGSAGTFSFTVSAEANGQTAEKTFTLEVRSKASSGTGGTTGTGRITVKNVPSGWNVSEGENASQIIVRGSNGIIIISIGVKSGRSLSDIAMSVYQNISGTVAAELYSSAEQTKTELKRDGENSPYYFGLTNSSGVNFLALIDDSTTDDKISDTDYSVRMFTNNNATIETLNAVWPEVSFGTSSAGDSYSCNVNYDNKSLLGGVTTNGGCDSGFGMLGLALLMFIRRK